MHRYSTKQILKEAAALLLIAALVECLVVLLLLGFDRQAAQITRHVPAKKPAAALLAADSAENACESAAIPGEDLPRVKQ